MFAQAKDLVDSMERVEIIKVGGANNELLGRAHILSRTASTSLKPGRN